MSNLDPAPEEVDLSAAPGVHHAVDILEARKAAIGDGTEVRRLLPQRVLRTIGAWCFIDHFGPDDVSAGRGMDVPPHPHIGLQTATWLFDGRVLHRDSLGSEQLIHPGELNLMTAGRGITHSEESLYPQGPSPLSTPGKGGKTPLSPPSPGEPAQSAGPRASGPAPAGHPLSTPGPGHSLLHGVQLWIALPRDQQFAEPGFAHFDDLPVVEAGGDSGARVTVVAGEYGGERSPAVVHTPLVGLQVALPSGGNVTLATRPDFEYGVLAADAPAAVTVRNGESSGAFGNSGVLGAGATGRADGTQFRPGMLAHVPAGSDKIELSAPGPCRFMVVGGRPLGERLVMWWNFVARSAAEIAHARQSWIDGDGRFGAVHGYAGNPLPAPPLPPGTLKPRLHAVTVSSIRDRLQTRVSRSTLRSRKRNPLHGRLERYGA